MARRPNRRKKKPTGLKPLTRGQVVTLWSVLLLASPLAYPSLICLGLALLPSFIAWKLESGGDRYLGGSIAVMNFPAGCKFWTRCPHVEERCKTVEPELVEVRPGRQCRCHLVEPEGGA